LDNSNSFLTNLFIFVIGLQTGCQQYAPLNLNNKSEVHYGQ
jgi:hypothetical protein